MELISRAVAEGFLHQMAAVAGSINGHIVAASGNASFKSGFQGGEVVVVAVET